MLQLLKISQWFFCYSLVAVVSPSTLAENNAWLTKAQLVQQVLNQLVYLRAGNFTMGMDNLEIFRSDW